MSVPAVSRMGSLLIASSPLGPPVRVSLGAVWKPYSMRSESKEALSTLEERDEFLRVSVRELRALGTRWKASRYCLLGGSPSRSAPRRTRRSGAISYCASAFFARFRPQLLNRVDPPCGLHSYRATPSTKKLPHQGILSMGRERKRNLGPREGRLRRVEHKTKLEKPCFTTRGAHGYRRAGSLRIAQGRMKHGGNCRDDRDESRWQIFAPRIGDQEVSWWRVR